MKIGLLGGTFDPIHYGHLAIAYNAFKQYKLDRVWFMPSPGPPHKRDVKKSSFEDRFEMTRLGVEAFIGELEAETASGSEVVCGGGMVYGVKSDCRGDGLRRHLLVSDYEMKLAQPSYSARTLAALHEDYPEDEFYFMVGEDSLDQIETWYEPARVLAGAKILVYGRFEEGDERSVREQIAYLTGKYECRGIYVIEGECVDVSSTQIRKLVREGASIEGLVPGKVEEYICQKKLYLEKTYTESGNS